jgi:hypothetical protein
MPLTQRQAQSLADELIENAKLQSKALRNQNATQPSLMYRYGLQDLAAFDKTDQAWLVQRAKTLVRRSIAFRVAVVAIVIANSGLLVAWFTGLFHASNGNLLPTTVAWLNAGFLYLLWLALVRYKIRIIAHAAAVKHRAVVPSPEPFQE